MVRRIYVEKRSVYAVEAREVLEDLRGNLGQDGIESLRILNRYDVENIGDDAYEKACSQIFAEPMVDHMRLEALPVREGEEAFAVEYLPGQYDQRADSAAQCIALLSGRDDAAVRTAKVYLLSGKYDIDKVKAYLINPVESREASMDKPKTLVMEFERPGGIPQIAGFISLSEREIEDMTRDMGLAMTAADLKFVQSYFRDEQKREPTLTELRVIDTYWSDHCRHTTFLTTLDEVTFDDGPVAQAVRKSFEGYLADRRALGRRNPPSLMDMALTGPRVIKARGGLADLDESEEINACSIVVPVEIDGKSEEWLVMFKNETHNHPTEIEPFGGAATCLGGAIRDPLSGRSYVYQAMRVTGSGDPTVSVSETLPNKLPQRKITQGAAHGFSSYGNQIGLATGQVVEIYHPGYAAKRMEIGAVVGAAPKDHVVREQPVPGDIVVLIGGRTGRDGCGGATGSSKAHTTDSLAECGAEVQKGNPVTERKLQRLFLNSEITRLIKRCNDFGAGGVSVAIGELAPGLLIDLDAVPRKYEGLDGTELAISESQERMAVVVAEGDVAAIIKGAAAENLEATPVATVTAAERLVMRWRGNTIVDLARSFLDTNGAEQHATAHVNSPKLEEYPYAKNPSISRDAWVAALSDLNACSQQGLAERFDSTIGSASVLMPYSGKYQKTPAQAMAAKLPVQSGSTETATIMAHGFDPALSSWSPYHGAMAAVIESVARVVAAGGRYEDCRLTFQEYFERLRNEPARWGKPVAALAGALEAQKQLGLASIGGKDSMSGSFMELDVPPTLVSFAVCARNAKYIRSGEIKRAGNEIHYLPARHDDHFHIDLTYQKKLFAAVSEAMEEGRIVSAYTVGTGGVAAAVSKMAFGNGLGVEIGKWPEEAGFTPRYGSFVVEAEGSLILPGVDAYALGRVIPTPVIRTTMNEISLSELLVAYEAPLNGVFPILGPMSKDVIGGTRAVAAPVITRSCPAIAQPRVVVPAFPGTNCELDTARAFEMAGARAEVMLFRNLNSADIEESVQALEKALRQAQIVALPGGFSAGDEPEGSAKYIVAAFNHPRIREAVMELLNQRDGLMIGICNGFQALVKLGLAPYGEYRDMSAGNPTLTFNSIGRHISRMVSTKVASKLSPWYSQCEVGDVHTIAISHGEGRFVAPEGELGKLCRNGQISTQYVDDAGNATMDPMYNSNGSLLAIEGICSPDGRVLGKMGHSERTVGQNVIVNVPGNKVDSIFRSGVAYFS